MVAALVVSVTVPVKKLMNLCGCSGVVSVTALIKKVMNFLVVAVESNLKKYESKKNTQVLKGPHPLLFLLLFLLLLL